MRDGQIYQQFYFYLFIPTIHTISYILEWEGLQNLGAVGQIKTNFRPLMKIFIWLFTVYDGGIDIIQDIDLSSGS